MRFILFFFILSFSVKASLFHVQKWDLVHPKLNSFIEKPIGVWITLLEGSLVQGNEKVCLFYRAPFSGRLAEAFFSYGRDCKWSPDRKKEMAFERLENFQVRIAKESLKIKLRKDNKKREVEIPTPNINKDSGFRFVNFIARPKNSLGKWEDNHRDQTSKVCHQFNEQCEEVVSNICSQCRYGWYEVVGKGCEKGREKYCGRDRCGERGQPACLRGFQYEKATVQSLCSENSPAVFCQKGLRAYCKEGKSLICL